MKYQNSKENNNRPMSVYTDGNPYGYKYNVNHPFINELYRRYKKWKGIAESFPMSDKERREFENYIDEFFANQQST